MGFFLVAVKSLLWDSIKWEIQKVGLFLVVVNNLHCGIQWSGSLESCNLSEGF